MKTRLWFLLFFNLIFSFATILQAQVTIGSDIRPKQGSLLDLTEYESDAFNATANKGLLLPRVALNTVTDFDPIVAGALEPEKEQHTGLMVFHVGSKNLCSGLYIWNGKKWEILTNKCQITLNKNSILVNGTYRVGTPLNSTNTITLTINVSKESVGGTYNIYTDTQNGMSFSATGTLTKGTQSITLLGAGTPASGGVDTNFTIYFEYSNSEAVPTMAAAQIGGVTIPIGKAKIFGFGSTPADYGYYLNTSASRTFLQSPNNFGANGTAKVNADGFDIITADLAVLTVANFVNSTTSGLGLNPDIMINGFETYTTSDVVIDEIVKYLENGGVLILFDEYGDGATTSISLRLFKKLFPDQANNISYKHLGAESSVYGMTTTVDDEITNGVFGDVRGTYWGEDASSTSGFFGLPLDSITVYSNGDILGGSISSANSPRVNPGYITMFKHKRLNLFFAGDGGFVSNYRTNIGPTYLGYYQYCPFAIDANYAPIPRNNWGLYGPAGGGKFTVHNSLIFANIMTWVITNPPSNKKK